LLKRLVATAFSAFLLFLISFLATEPLKAQGVRVRVNNLGEIPVYVAVYDYGGLFGRTRLSGWYKIEPSRWREPTVYLGPPGSTYYAFAIMKNGRLGSVDYRPRRDSGSHIGMYKNYYLNPDRSFNRIDRGHAFTKSSRQGSVAVPFTWHVLSYDQRTKLDTSIVVRPTRNDRVIKWLTPEPRRRSTKDDDCPRGLSGRRFCGPLW